MQHPDEGTIHAWLDDALPADEAARVAAHVETCEQCAATVAEARGLIAGASRIVSSLDSVRGGVIPAKAPVVAAKRQRSVWRTLHLTPARAGLIAAALIGVVLVEGRGERGERIVNNPGLRAETSGVRVINSPAPPAVQTAPVVGKGAEKPAAAAPTAVIGRDVEPKGGNGAPRAAERGVAGTAVSAPASVPASAPPSASPPAASTSPSNAQALPAPALRRSAVAGFEPQMQQKSASAGFARVQAAVAGASGGPDSFVGCYDVQQAPATSLRPLPDRFALERVDSANGTRENVVRPIEADGRRAEPLPGSAWRQVSEVAANVTWVSDGRQRMLRLLAGANGVIGRTDSVVVLKTECR
jgi:hypothetical protein